MSVVSPPGSRQDELELLIREARARQLRRRLGIAALVALVAGAALGIHAIVGGKSRATVSATQRGAPVAAKGRRCGIRVKGARILQGGRTVYREPGHLVNPDGGPPAAVQCSGPSVWVVWVNGAAMSQEAYVGVRSRDAGHTWRLVFSESYFGVKAPHELDAYFGPWKLGGPRTAYFTGSCPACSLSASRQGTVSL
jgi:hypothetical protein